MKLLKVPSYVIAGAIAGAIALPLMIMLYIFFGGTLVGGPLYGLSGALYYTGYFVVNYAPIGFVLGAVIGGLRLLWLNKIPKGQILSNKLP